MSPSLAQTAHCELGLAKNGGNGKMAVKGVLYDQEKHIRDLNISDGIGGGGQRRGSIGGGGL